MNRDVKVVTLKLVLSHFMSSLQPSNNSASSLQVHPSVQTEVNQLELCPASFQGSPSSTAEVDATARISALEAELQQYREKAQGDKTKKNKNERVKAVFNVLNNFVKYYNTGETYFSRIFTLVGLGGIIAGSLFGVSQLPPVKNQLSQLTPIFHGLLPASESPQNTLDRPAPIANSDSLPVTRQSPTIPVVASPPVVTSPPQPSVKPPTAAQRKPSLPAVSTLPASLPAPPVQAAVNQVRQATEAIPKISQDIEQVKKQVEQIVPSIPVAPPSLPQIQILHDTPDTDDDSEDD